MTGRDRLYLVGLLVCSLVLAALEVLYLPLRFDGVELPLLFGGMPFPITAVVALVTVPMLVSKAAQVSPRLVVAGIPLAGWLLVVVVTAFPGPGGDIVLVPDWRALLLLGCGGLAGAVALGGAIGRAARRP